MLLCVCVIVCVCVCVCVCVEGGGYNEGGKVSRYLVKRDMSIVKLRKLVRFV